MVGTFEFRWSSLFVIWQCQPQSSHPQAVEDATGFDVTIRLRVPLWQDDNGGAWFILSLTAGREQPRARKVIFRSRSFDRTGPCQTISNELPVRNLRQCIEVLAPSHHLFGVLAKDHTRIVAVRVLANKFGAPRKRPYDAIIVAFCVRNLARAHPSSEQIGLAHFKTANKSCTFSVSHPKVEPTGKSSKQTVLERSSRGCLCGSRPFLGATPCLFSGSELV